VSAVSKHDLFDLERDDFGDAKSGFYGYEHQGVIAAPYHLRLVGRSQEGVNLIRCEESDLVAVEPALRDCEHTLDEGAMCGFLEGRIPEEGVDCRQPGVTSADGVLAFLIEIDKEAPNERSVEVFEKQCAGSFTKLVLGEAEEEAKGVTVGGDRVGARLELAL
jgi:hypothetical protein